MTKLSFLIPLIALVTRAVGIPQYQSLAGLTERELQALIPRLNVVPAPQPPLPINDTSVKLVNDPAHPFMPLRPGDIRGPCPGLNTLASHGYLPRNGIATPGQIITAAQEGFGMDFGTASVLAFATMLVDGNPLTNLMSIGSKTNSTGPNPPTPAIVGGLDTHAVFEGDASMTRLDFFFGDNHDFNPGLFSQFVNFSNTFGGGNYNLTVAAELRFARIQESIATNPTFSLLSPRFSTAYGESAFALVFFVDGRKADGILPIDDALSFFRDHHFPDDFHRNDASQTPDLVNNAVSAIFAAHPTQPGKNNGTAVNSFTVDPNSPNLSDGCGLYTNFVQNIFLPLYPNPTGILKDNLNANLGFFFNAGFSDGNCTQLFPFGQ